MNSDQQDQLRRRYLAANKARERSVARLVKSGISELRASLEVPLVDLGPFLDLRCGARGKRTGLPCPHKSLYANGRCRWHGGLSTGPRSPDGKARSAKNVGKRWLAPLADEDIRVMSAASPLSVTDPASSPRAGLDFDKTAINQADSQVPQSKPHESPMKDYIQAANPSLNDSPARTPRTGGAGTLGRIRSVLQTAGDRGMSLTRIAMLTHQSKVEVESTIGFMRLLGQIEVVNHVDAGTSAGTLRFRLKH